MGRTTGGILRFDDWVCDCQQVIMDKLHITTFEVGAAIDMGLIYFCDPTCEHLFYGEDDEDGHLPA